MGLTMGIGVPYMHIGWSDLRGPNIGGFPTKVRIEKISSVISRGLFIIEPLSVLRHSRAQRDVMEKICLYVCS